MIRFCDSWHDQILGTQLSFYFEQQQQKMLNGEFHIIGQYEERFCFYLINSLLLKLEIVIFHAMI